MRVKKNQTKKQPSKITPKKQGAVEQAPELVFNPINTENTPTVSEETTVDAVVANEPITEESASISKTIEQQNAQKAMEKEVEDTDSILPELSSETPVGAVNPEEDFLKTGEEIARVDEANLVAYEETIVAEQTESAPIESEVELPAEQLKESLDKYTEEQLNGVLKVMIDFDLQSAFLGLRGAEVFLYSIPNPDCGMILITEITDRLEFLQNEE
jgi:hypothetical protein